MIVFNKKQNTPVISKSENMSTEYCCTIVKIGEVTPIKNSDFLGSTIVEGRTIVVRKDKVKSGDIMFYVSNECEINRDFLAANNEFEMHCHDLNYNHKTVDDLLEKADTCFNKGDAEQYEHLMAEAKNMVGFFNRQGRVRMIKLRGVLSMGYLFNIDAMKKWYPSLTTTGFNIEDHIGEDFDTVNGVLFVKAYMPPVKVEVKHERKNFRNKALKKFDRMIPGQFSFHYDTAGLQKSGNIKRLNPDDYVFISNKLHGSSFIIGNILVKTPKFGKLYSKMFNYLPSFLQFTTTNYDVIYSSRRVIQNSTINFNRKGYSKGLTKCFDTYYELLKNYIPKDTTIYCEIIGYEEGSNQFIQTVGLGYDYMCETGKNKLMIYRVSRLEEDGNRHELNIDEVYDWTIDLINRLPEQVKDRIHPIDIMYQGTLKDLYPDIPVDENWHDKILEAMKNDTKHFGMELHEPMCRNKVYREGFVLRIKDDPITEAFKLKCEKFLNKESESISSGNFSDSESEERYN